MEVPQPPAKKRAARAVQWLHDDIVFMLRLLLELEPAARPNRMAGVHPWSIVANKFVARGPWSGDYNFQI